jgi:hypothetical protein
VAAKHLTSAGPASSISTDLQVFSNTSAFTNKSQSTSPSAISFTEAYYANECNHSLLPTTGGAVSKLQLESTKPELSSSKYSTPEEAGSGFTETRSE